jgi:hypothetical protein
MKYAVEMGSGAMIHMPSFMNPLDIQKLRGGRGIQRHTDIMMIPQAKSRLFKIRKVG